MANKTYHLRYLPVFEEDLLNTLTTSQMFFKMSLPQIS